MKLDVEYNNVPQRPLNIWEKYQVAEMLSQYPAVCLKVLMHWKVGLRRAEPTHVFIMAGILYGIGSLFHSWLVYYAVAVTVAGYWQHINRWKGLRAGEKWHTASDGVSPIEELFLFLHRLKPAPATVSPIRQLPAARTAATKKSTLPRWLQQPVHRLFSVEWWLTDSRIYRKLDPLAVYLIALPFFAVDRPLAVWLVFSSACLAVDQNHIWRHQIKQYLDWYDSQIDAALMKGWGGQKKRRGQAKPRSATFGIPTGIGEDIRERVQAQAEQQQRQRLAEQVSRQRAIPAALLADAPNNLAI